MDIVKFVPLVDGIVDLSQFEIKLKNRKDKLKIFRADDQSLKDRKRPLFAGPAAANDTEPLKENSRQVEKFVENIIRSKDQLSQIKKMLKEEDIEWLGINWYKARVGLKTNPNKKMPKKDIFLQMINENF